MDGKDVILQAAAVLESAIIVLGRQAEKIMALDAGAVDIEKPSHRRTNGAPARRAASRRARRGQVDLVERGGLVIDLRGAS